LVVVVVVVKNCSVLGLYCSVFSMSLPSKSLTSESAFELKGALKDIVNVSDGSDRVLSGLTSCSQ